MTMTVNQAIVAQESHGDPNAYNPVSGATGKWQITQAYLDDANRFAGTRYTLDDMRNPDISDFVVQKYQEYYFPIWAKQLGQSELTPSQIARSHFGGFGAIMNPGAHDASGKTAAQYSDEVLNRLGGSRDSDPRNTVLPYKATFGAPSIVEQGFDWSRPGESAFQMMDTLGKSLEAAGRQVNSIGSLATALSYESQMTHSFDRNYNVYDGLDEKYLPYYDAFFHVHNEHDAGVIKSRIDQELEDKHTLATSGAAGMVAGLAAGIIDPINMIPFGEAATLAKGAGLLKAAGYHALVGAGAMTTIEAALHATQVARTTDESIANITAGALLSGVLGGALHGLSARRTEALTDAVARDLGPKVEPTLHPEAEAPVEPITVQTHPMTGETTVVRHAEPTHPTFSDVYTMSEMEGQYVDYQGNFGKLRKSDEGYFVELGDGERVFVESGESGRTGNSLGVMPAAGLDEAPVLHPEVSPVSSVREAAETSVFNPDTNVVHIYGKDYEYVQANVNAEGDTVSLTLRNAEGKEITVRNKEIVDAIEVKKIAWEYERAAEPLHEITPEHIQEAYVSEEHEAGHVEGAEQGAVRQTSEGVKEGVAIGKAEAAGPEPKNLIELYDEHVHDQHMSTRQLDAAERAARRSELIGRAPQNLDELVSQMKVVSKSLTQKQADRIHSVYETFAKYLGVDPDEFVRQAFGSVLHDEELGKDLGGYAHKAAVEFMRDGKAVIHAFQSTNLVDFLHETFHVFRRYMPKEDLAVVEKACKVIDGKWDRKAEERFAHMAEKYWSSGKAPNKKLKSIFDDMKQWFRELYPKMVDSGANISKEMHDVFDKMFGGEKTGAGVPDDSDQLTLFKTVEVEGKARPTVDSDGEPIAHDEQSVKNFWKWFDKSKMVDKSGKPIRFWHHGGFDEVEHGVPNMPMHLGTERAARDRAYGYAAEHAMDGVEVTLGEDDRWHWEDADGFSSYDTGATGFDTREEAMRHAKANAPDMYDRDVDDLGSMTSGYVNIENPMRTSDHGNFWDDVIQDAKDAGHDGIVYVNKHEDIGSESVIIFKSEQLKSVNNSGAYGMSNPNILYRDALTEEQLLNGEHAEVSPEQAARDMRAVGMTPTSRLLNPVRNVLENMRLDADLTTEQAAQYGLKDSKWFRWVHRLNPVMDLLYSPFPNSKIGIQKLAMLSNILERNVTGKANVVPVELATEPYIVALENFIDKTNQLFMEYRGWDPNTNQFSRWMKDRNRPEGVLSYDEFWDEVSKARRRNDEHSVPQVVEAAKMLDRAVFLPTFKEAVNMGILESNPVMTAPGYLTRIWDTVKILSRWEEFLGRVQEYLYKPGIHRGQMELFPEMPAGYNELEKEQMATWIANRIIGTPAGRLPFTAEEIDTIWMGKFPPALRGPLRERVLTMLPDLEFEDFLVNDARRVAEAYTKNIAADIELTRAFGSVDMMSVFKGIENDFNATIKANPDMSSYSRVLLRKRMDRDIVNFQGIRDRVRHTYKRDEWATGLGKIIRGLKDFNILRMMGGATITSTVDAGALVMRYGYDKLFGDLVQPLIEGNKNILAMLKDKDLLHDFGIATEMSINQRIRSLDESYDQFNLPSSKFATGLHDAANVMSILNLMSTWSDGLRKITAITAQSQLIKMSRRLVEGTATAEEVARLAQAFIDEPTARTILDQVDRHGDMYNGVLIPNTRMWDIDNPEVFQAHKNFCSGVRFETHNVIVSSGQDRPFILSQPVPSLLGQYKSFAFSATQRILITGAQRRDAAVLQGAATMIGLGMLVYALKTTLAGKEVSDDPKVWIAEGVLRSGGIGVLGDAHDAMEDLTGGRVGLRSWAGEKRNYKASGIFTSFPTASTVQLGDKIFNDTWDGQWNTSTTDALKKLTPYNNVFYARKVFDIAGDRLNEIFGVPEPKNKK